MVRVAAARARQRGVHGRGYGHYLSPRIYSYDTMSDLATVRSQARANPAIKYLTGLLSKPFDVDTSDRPFPAGLGGAIPIYAHTNDLIMRWIASCYNAYYNAMNRKRADAGPGYYEVHDEDVAVLQMLRKLRDEQEFHGQRWRLLNRAMGAAEETKEWGAMALREEKSRTKRKQQRKEMEAKIRQVPRNPWMLTLPQAPISASSLCRRRT